MNVNIVVKFSLKNVIAILGHIRSDFADLTLKNKKFKSPINSEVIKVSKSDFLV